MDVGEDVRAFGPDPRCSGAAHGLFQLNGRGDGRLAIEAGVGGRIIEVAGAARLAGNRVDHMSR